MARRCAVAWVSARSAGMLGCCSNAQQALGYGWCPSVVGWRGAHRSKMPSKPHVVAQPLSGGRGRQVGWEGVLGATAWGGSGVAFPVIRFARQVRIAVSWASAKGCAKSGGTSRSR